MAGQESRNRAAEKEQEMHTFSGQGRQPVWQKLPVLVLSAFVCCFLWGSAFPCIKAGYRLFHIAAADTGSQMLFAGVRFTLAGLLVLLFGSIGQRRVLRPRAGSAKYILCLALAQTIGQYFFFYVGLAHTSGVNGSIIGASSTFFSILIAALLFHYERLTGAKILGSLLGFAGVLLILLPGSGGMRFSLLGDGFILCSTLSSALSSVLISGFSKKEDPVVLSGWQFTLGGIVLALLGFGMGGRLTGFTPASCLLLLYMACISSVAYTLWSVLLKYNPVSRVTVFFFFNPIVGVMLSALILGEQNQAFTIYGLGALLLVSLGIIVVNRRSA